MEFWFVLGLAVCGVLTAVGLIFAMYWLIVLGFAAIAATGAGAIITYGPGSSFNPYKH